MKILSLDSSATCASVALFDTESKKIIGDFFINTKLTHSQTLVPMLDALLKSTKTELSDVNYFAVNTGPGSFTGIRIGVSVAKGMAMALDKKCVSISTLESMAYNFIDEDDVVVCACMDARRNQIYNALFAVKDKSVTRMCEDRAIKVDDLLKELETFSQKIILVGDGAHLCCNVELSDNIILAHDSKRYQNASSVALCAENYIENNDVSSASSLMPTYLRPSQAERERLEKEGK